MGQDKRKYEIYFNAYHEGSMWSREELSPPRSWGAPAVEKIWDGYEDGGLMGDAGIPREQIAKVFQARVDWASQRQVIPEDYRYELLGEEPHFGDEEFDLFILRVEDLTAFKDHFVNNWIPLMLSREPLRGADDGTFDYYPDLWSISAQIARAVGEEEAYRAARTTLLETTDYGDEANDMPSYIEEI